MTRNQQCGGDMLMTHLCQIYVMVIRSSNCNSWSYFLVGTTVVVYTLNDVAGNSHICCVNDIVEESMYDLKPAVWCRYVDDP